jgi:hypothetical protein
MTATQEAAPHSARGWRGGFACSTPIRAYSVAEFNLQHPHSGCIKLLARRGCEYRKPKPQPQPKVASAEKQSEFIALYERLISDLSADEAVYSADAVHPEYPTRPAFGWLKTGFSPAVKTTAVRGRVNIHDALGARDLRRALCRARHRQRGQRHYKIKSSR